MPAHGLMLHHFTDGHRHPEGQGAISADELRAMLEQMGVNRFLDPAEWVARSAEGQLREDDLCVTLDDGLLCQYEVALPVFEALGLRAFWFVYSSVFEGSFERLELYRFFRSTAFNHIGAFYEAFFACTERAYPALWARTQNQFDATRYLSEFPFYSDDDRRFRFLRDEVLGIERYNNLMDNMLNEWSFDAKRVAHRLWLNNDHLRRLYANGHVIGLHSTTHPTRIERLTTERQMEEYRRNRDHIMRITGSAPQTASHPCNSYSSETLRILGGLGIRMAFRSNMTLSASHGPLELPREDHANLRTRTA